MAKGMDIDMKIVNDLKNRYGIFLFYDRDGIVDDYIVYMLRDIRKSLSHLLVVCNGAPGEEGLKILKEESDEVMIRANEGFDVGGYREGLFYAGFKELENYDEVVMFNYTFFGGIYPFSEMFEKMSGVDVDFWGITKHHEVDYDPYGKIRYGYMPGHIQSHFLVIRRSLLASDDYKKFIISMKNPASYVESICDYESIFTKHFEDLGYKWDVYVNTDRYERYAYCPVMFYIKDLLMQDRCPIIKRRSFFTRYQDFLINTCGEPSVEAYDYLRQNIDYDVNMIWDNILRLENMSEVSKAMHLNYCLPDEVSYSESETGETALSIWAKDTSCLQFYEEHLKALQGQYPVFLYGEEKDTDSVKVLLGKNHQISIFNKKISDMQEFLQEIKGNGDKTCKNYGVLVIDTVEKVRPYSNQISNVYKDWNCIAASDEYISNVAMTFSENTRMGLGIPPVPDFGEYFAKYADGWHGRFEDVSEYLKQCKIKANINKDTAPLAPVGGSFWITEQMLHGEQMEAALNVKTDDEVFLLALASIVQAQKCYTGVLYSNRYAEIEVTNSDYMMRELNKVVFETYGANYHNVILDRVKNHVLERDLIPVIPQDNSWKGKTKRRIKRILPQSVYRKGKKVYFRIRGREFTE